MYRKVRNKIQGGSRRSSEGENDGFPLPCTAEELHAFDKDAFVEDPPIRSEKKSKKRDRQRSKSVTAIPDLSSLKLKLQKIQSPGKPKFLEHLINRVVSRKLGKKEDSGLVSVEESEVFGPEPLSPTSENCLEAAESLVEELLSCSVRRPASGESTDSGKGSLLESTSDFSPTQKRTSWSTPASPTFQGIVKERLKGFQALSAVSSSEIDGSSSSIPALGQQKTFQDSENPTTNDVDNLKRFYCSLAHDEQFTTAVMSKGYVKALVQRINTLQIDEFVDSDDESVSSCTTDEKITANGSVKVKNGSISDSVKQFENGAHSDAHKCSESSGAGSPSLTPRSSRTNSESSDSHVSKVLQRFNRERTRNISSSFTHKSSSVYNSNSSSNSPSVPRHHNSANPNAPSRHDTNGAAADANSLSCDTDSCRDEDTDVTNGGLSPSLSVEGSPLSPAELFEQHWSKSEIVFDDFDDDLDKNSQKPKEDETPKDKLHQIASELLTTERAYVARLHLIDQVFQFRIQNENNSSTFMPPEDVVTMFSHIKPIYQFHKDFLLPQLEERMANWSQEQKIGDIMAKLAPFLKLYTGYVKNFDNAMNTIDKWTSQSPKFAALLQKIQQEPECGQLALQHHMLGPIQRVPRYEMLLKDYLKRLPSDAADKADAQKALDLVTQAAHHSNTAMKKLEKFHKLLLIIQKLNGAGIDDLVSPTRELMKEGPITKISARSGEKQGRYLFLFNDLLLVCSEQIMGSYKIRAHLSVDCMEVLPGENIAIQNTFCIKCTEKTVEFLDETNNGQGVDWLATFEEVITNYQIKEEAKRRELRRGRSDATEPDDVSPEDHVDLSPNMLGKRAPTWVKDEEVTMCMACREKFTKLRRRHHCRACGKVFCGRCSSRKVRLQYDSNQLNRVCQRCHDKLSQQETSDDPIPPTSPKGPIRINDVEADKASLLACYLYMMDKSRTWTRRWITVHADFVMYFYKKNKDVSAIMTLPLPGHVVKVIGEADKTDKQLNKQFVFCLAHKDVNVVYFQTDSEDQLNQWVRVLEKMVLLELPSEEEKRHSTHSSESSSSNASSLSTLS